MHASMYTKTTYEHDGLFVYYYEMHYEELLMLVVIEAEQSVLWGADWRSRKTGGRAVCKHLRPQEAGGVNLDSRVEEDGYLAL